MNIATAYNEYDNAGKPGWMGAGGPAHYPGGPDGCLGEVVQYRYDASAALFFVTGFAVGYTVTNNLASSYLEADNEIRIYQNSIFSQNDEDSRNK